MAYKKQAETRQRAEEPEVIAPCDECRQPIFAGRGDYNRWKGAELHGKCVAKRIKRETAECAGCKGRAREEDAA